MDSGDASGDGRNLDIEQIKQLIPHRYPFLMIDRIADLIPDVSAVGIKNVSINEPYFQGHFPSRPIMPGVLIIETMAQTSAALVMHTMGEDAKGRLVYFMSVESARFRKPITPGDTLHVHVEKLQRRGRVWKFAGQAKVEGTLMAEATYTAIIADS